MYGIQLTEALITKETQEYYIYLHGIQLTETLITKEKQEYYRYLHGIQLTETLITTRVPQRVGVELTKTDLIRDTNMDIRES